MNKKNYKFGVVEGKKDAVRPVTRLGQRKVKQVPKDYDQS